MKKVAEALVHANHPVHYSVSYKVEHQTLKVTAYKERKNPVLKGELRIENEDQTAKQLEFEGGIAVRLTHSNQKVDDTQFITHPHQNGLKELVLKEFAERFGTFFNPNGALRSRMSYFSELEPYVN